MRKFKHMKNKHNSTFASTSSYTNQRQDQQAFDDPPYFFYLNEGAQEDSNFLNNLLAGLGFTGSMIPRWESSSYERTKCRVSSLTSLSRRSEHLARFSVSCSTGPILSLLQSILCYLWIIFPFTLTNTGNCSEKMEVI